MLSRKAGQNAQASTAKSIRSASQPNDFNPVKSGYECNDAFGSCRWRKIAPIVLSSITQQIRRRRSTLMEIMPSLLSLEKLSTYNQPTAAAARLLDYISTGPIVADKHEYLQFLNRSNSAGFQFLAM
jgi:hypothetical protein